MYTLPNECHGLTVDHYRMFIDYTSRHLVKIITQRYSKSAVGQNTVKLTQVYCEQ